MGPIPVWTDERTSEFL